MLRSAATTFFIILLTFIYFCWSYLIENNCVIIVYLTFTLTRISKSAFAQTLINTMRELNLALINWEFPRLLLLAKKILRNIWRLNSFISVFFLSFYKNSAGHALVMGFLAVKLIFIIFILSLTIKVWYWWIRFLMKWLILFNPSLLLSLKLLDISHLFYITMRNNLVLSWLGYWCPLRRKQSFSS